MKINRTASTWPLFALLVSLLVVASSGNSVPASLSAKAQDLWQLQAASDKVVPLDTALFDTHASGKGRPYALVVFMTAEYMMDKGQLQLRKLRQEYGMAAKAFAKKHDATENAGKVFFTEVSLTKSGDLFHRMGVQHLPYVAIIPGSQNVKAGAAISLSDDQRMKHEMFDHYPWTAEDFCGFISDHTGLGCAEIHRPTLASNPLFPIIMVAVLSALGYVGWKVYVSEFIKNKAIWVAACLFVYWFATSGGLYNIIRGIPLTMPDHASGKIRWFMQGQGQLGAEGFFNGTMYLLFTLCMVGITQFHHSSDFLGSKGKGVLMYVLLLCMLFVGIKVYDFYTFKTGMRFKTYLF